MGLWALPTIGEQRNKDRVGFGGWDGLTNLCVELLEAGWFVYFNLKA